MCCSIDDHIIRLHAISPILYLGLAGYGVITRAINFFGKLNFN